MTIQLELKPRLLREGDITMGPGKADLLDAIGHTGSISAAARSMNMSYRRARGYWLTR
jgi:molybdate transport system regulatory protein